MNHYVIFIKKTKEYMYIPYKYRGVKHTNNGLKQFIQNIVSNGRKDESKDEKVDQSNANAIVNYIKVMLESIRLIKIIHIKLRKIIDVKDDKSDCKKSIDTYLKKKVSYQVLT